MRWFYSKYRWLLKKIWPVLAGVFLLNMAENAISLYIPYKVGQVIDLIARGELTEMGLRGDVLLIVGLAFLLYVVSFLWGRWLQQNELLMNKALRSKFFEHLVSMPPSFHQRHRTGDLLNHAGNEVSAISAVLGEGVLSLTNILVTFPFYLLTMLFYVDVKLTLVSLIPLLFIPLSIHFLGGQIQHRASAFLGALGQMNHHVLESISGMRVLRSFVQEQGNLASFAVSADKVASANKRLAMTNAVYWPAINMASGLALAVAIGYGAYLVFLHEISLGQLVTFIVYVNYMSFPMFAFGSLVNTMRNAKAAEDRFSQVMDDTASLVEEGNELPEYPVRIEGNELSFRYPDTALNGLNGISFRLERGKTLGITGAVGSGKSTLAKLLLRQYAVDANQILVAGIPIERIKADHYKRWFGYVPQEHMLFSKSILYNLLLGKPTATMEEISLALNRACLEEEIREMENGIHTIIGEGGVRLSGGQKQRLAIARALLADPEILLLDDAFSSVDTRTEHAILEHIRTSRQEKTTIIISHKLSALKHADEILVLQDGRVMERGTHERLLEQQGWYYRQYERQQMELAQELKNAGGEVTA
ncbi:ABC transporter ATP-binding protein [Brevibacillus migulae]|uniref:ABC transporter ATP-binding protein n=1 Tax=Brevibacillus migulae TaxID=1644114 RepID=UPI00106EA3E7|nr:ABC transporter ATP-binding protein [Brevibacillus migulae]